MDALHALHSRVSVPRLTGPAPTPRQVEALLQAALRAPDHAWLRPWRFLLLEQQGLERLGDLFGQVALRNTPDISADVLARYQGLPLRAPMMIIAIARHVPHPKVPEAEQDMSCAVAVGNLLLAAHAMGLGAVWRTGEMAAEPLVQDGLGLAENEKIIAFVYLGQPAGGRKPVPELKPADYLEVWAGN